MLKIVIPARSGSKRVPDKNIKPVIPGKRTIDIVIDNCKLAFPFSEIIVSTDYPMDKFQKYKKSEMVKFHKRSPESANDTATLADVLKEVMSDHPASTYLMVLPTSILATPKMMQLANKVYKTNKKTSLFCACKYGHPIHRAITISPTRDITFTNKDKMQSQTQAFKDHYFDAGQFYYVSYGQIKNDGLILTDNSYPYIINEHQFQDIDNESDFIAARQKYILSLLKTL